MTRRHPLAPRPTLVRRRPGRNLSPRAPKPANRSVGVRSVALTAVMGLLATLGIVLAWTPPAAAVPAPTCTSAGLTLTSAQGTNPVFYIDPSSTPVLDSAYAGWRVTNSGASSRANLWVRLAGFTSTGTLTLGVSNNEPNAYPLGDLAASASRVSYTFLTASGASTAAQDYRVQVWSGDPRLSSSTQVCETPSSYLRVDTTIQASANKVSGTLVGPNPAGLGGILQLTVYGQGTGTIGSGPTDNTDPAVFWLTPAAVSGWQPNAYRLTRTRLYIDPDGNGGLAETLYTDQLRLNNLTGGDRPYRIIYEFVAIGVTAGSTTTYPVQNIASGTQVKHTTLTGYSTFPAIQPVSNVTTVTKATPRASALLGQVPFTVTVHAGDFGTTSADLNGDGDTSDSGETTTNSGSLDSIRDVLPVGTTFVSGSATWKGTAIADPSNASGTLTFAGPFVLASNTNPVLSYRLNMPTAGQYTNSASALVGATRIDTTLLTTDNAPATATVQVGPTTAALTRSAASVRFGSPVTLTTTVGPESPTGTVTFTGTSPGGAITTLGTAPVVDDVATLSTTLPTFGLNTVTASYGGDGTHESATSNPVTVEVAAYEGEVIVTERRTSGPGGANDSYIELYNTGPAVPLAGFEVKTDSGASVTIPSTAGTLGRWRSYLLAGSQFSLGAVATPDQVENSLGTGGVSVIAPDTARTSTDQMGLSSGYHRGAPLPGALGASLDQHAWVRVETAGRPTDTGANAADFALVSDNGAVVAGVQSMLGSPSPTGTADPYQHNAELRSYLLDPTKGAAVEPNRAYVVGTPGTLEIRRRITNTSTDTITNARVRITALSEANGLARAGTQPVQVAQLRAVNPRTPTSLTTVSGRGGVLVANLGVDAPSTSLGGGLNSTMTLELPQGGLAPGASVDVAMTFDVDTRGTFWFGYDVDATHTAGPSVQPLRAGSTTLQRRPSAPKLKAVRAPVLSKGRL